MTGKADSNSIFRQLRAVTPRPPPAWKRYGVAIVATAVALALNYLKQPFINDTSIALFFAAVMVSAWYGGLGPGLLASGFASVASIFFLLAPMFSMAVGLDGAIRVAVLLTEAVVISSLAARSRAANELLNQTNFDLENLVRQRTAALEESNRQLRGFCYTVAHDLRAPLRAMEGFSQALIEEAGSRLDENCQDYARRISGGAVRMDCLIRDLLDYTDLSQARLHVQKAGLDEIVERAARKFSSKLRDGNVSIEIEEPLPAALCDPGITERILSELISNALKFVEPGAPARIRIRAEPRGKAVRVWVEDTGIGIDPQYQERIFGVFERLHSMELYPGTGIGLAMVSKGVERMDGRAGVESEPGNGSHFWIELPKAA